LTRCEWGERLGRMATTWAVFPAVLLSLFLTATTGYSFTALYAFGDSLSDTGRSPAPGSSYFNGRYSNGPLWVEYLSVQLGLSYNASNNFAVSGSTTSALASQITGLAPSTNLHAALFTVWSAGNDFQQNVSLGVNDAGWSNVVATAVFKPDERDRHPFHQRSARGNCCQPAQSGSNPAASSFPPGFPAYLDTKIAQFNAMLATALTNVMQRNVGLRIYPLDANSLFNSILSAPATFGFTVTTNGALEDPGLTDKSFTGPGANYVFWDIIHPTTKLHALIASVAFQNVGVELNLAHSGANLDLTILNLSPGLPYTIQSSTNLSAWSDYQTFTAAGTNATVTVTNTPGTNVFYRVRY